jgi:adenine-specific DNA-methyltransferase
MADYEVPEPTLNAAPFEAGEHGQIAVKVIDDRGNELMVVKGLSEAK